MWYMIICLGNCGLSKLYKYLPVPVLNYRTRLSKPFTNLEQQYIGKKISCLVSLAVGGWNIWINTPGAENLILRTFY